MTIKDHKAIRKAVEAARKQSPIADDALFLCVKDAEVGLPAMVYTPEGEPAFWMVPFLAGNVACGFAWVELSGKVIRIGIFGSTPDDYPSWIDALFFERPPTEILSEIPFQYPEFSISEPVLSYDTIPSKWAWKLEVRKGDKIKSIVFITPGGWYERQPGKEKTEFEG